MRKPLQDVVTAYRSKSAIRDVGKALGFALEVVDRLAKTAYRTDQRWISEACLLENELDPTDQRVQKWLQLAYELRDFPRHLSQHPSGFVIARDKLSRLVPVENASMENRSVVQWDKNDLDALGLIKVDVLALGMLTAIHRALDLVAMKLGQTFGMQEVPAEDPATYEMICKADTVGVFQIESRAQMTMLPRSSCVAERGVRTAEELRTQAHDRDKVTASGIVTHREQPSTSKGVMFATLEDETGTVHIIVWPKLAAEQRSALRQSRLLTVEGIWQSEKGVNSLVAVQLWDHIPLLGELRVSSRDFR